MEEEYYNDDDCSDMDTADDYTDDGRASPALSLAPSLVSYASSIDAQTMLRDVHGRVFNSANETYFLPADSIEHGRQDLQHMLLHARLGGLYIRPDVVRRVLSPDRDGPTPAVLDIGTGSGSWPIAMGHEFPHAEITGLDLAPANLSSLPPPNVKFECDDANLGFAHYVNSFDVVHCRTMSIGIDNFPALLKEIAAMLRPGGIFIYVEGDLQLYDEDFKPRTSQSPDEPGFAWTQKMLHAAYSAIKDRGGAIDMPHMATKWLRDMDDWDEVGEEKFFIPVGPWDPNLDNRMRYCAELMRRDSFALSQAMRPMLLSQGYFEETVDSWITGMQSELGSLNVNMYTKWHTGYAIKKGGPEP